MSAEGVFATSFRDHAGLVESTRRTIAPCFARLVDACVASVRDGGKIVFFGNGGSAADAQHLAAELVGRYTQDRPPIPALALTTDTSALTAIGNDFGFEQIFSRQIEALCRPGDVCIGISTSGGSENVIRGLQAARERRCVAAGFSGRGGGLMVGLADPLLIVPSDTTARIQEMHILLGHILCGALEIELGLT